MHASKILAAAEAALQPVRIKTSSMSIHGWQVRHIAGAARIAHGSSTVFVGTGSSAVGNQQRRSEVTGSTHTRHAKGISDRAKITMAVQRAREQFKGEGLIIRTIDSDSNDFTLIITTKARLKLWAHHCKGRVVQVDSVKPRVESAPGFSA